MTFVGFAGTGYLLRNDLLRALQPIDVHVTYGLEGERGPVPSLVLSPRQAEAESPGPTSPKSAPSFVPGQPPAATAFERPIDHRDWTEEPVDARATGVFGPGQSKSVRPAVFQSATFSSEDFRFRPLEDAPASSYEGVVGNNREDDLLNRARRAFWNDDLPAAVGHYQALIKAFPNNPDYLGELGNVYFEQRERELAAQAYFESAVRLENQGERHRAVKLAELLQKIDPTYAKALEEYLDSSGQVESGQ